MKFLKIKHNASKNNIRYLLQIFFSYLFFLLIIAVFGKGYGAIESLCIVGFASFISIFYVMYKTRNIVFKNIDYFIVIIIFLIQAAIGIIHFHNIINPAYFTKDVLGVDTAMNSGRYYYDIAYFALLLDSIAEYRLNEGFFAMDPGALIFGHKNYFFAFMFSDIFYYGDAYVLNIMALNILFLFYAGIILALITNKLFERPETRNIRVIFYLTILQPIAWIPSHTMRDVLGAFLVIFSVALVYFSIKRSQKIIFSVISMGLVFQHRSAYALSMLGYIIFRNLSQGRSEKWFGILILTVLFFCSYLLFFSNTGQIFSNIILASRDNSLLSGADPVQLLAHFISLVLGPFPWTQYFDGSVQGYVGFYSSTFILQAAWHLTIIYFLVINIKNIFKSREQRLHFYAVLLFAFPAIFSLGGMNLYLLGPLMMALVFLQGISLSRFFTTFLASVSFYISVSALFYFSKF